VTKYLIENIGEAEQPITLAGGSVVRLGRGQNLLIAEDDIAPEILAWANQSVGLRVTKRAKKADPEPEAKPPAESAKTKPAAKA
jgi:hypothetical protein